MRRCLAIVLILLACCQVSRAAALVELRGDGKAIGDEHGKLLGDQVRELRDKYLRKMIDTTSKWLVSRAAAGIFETKLQPQHQAEVKALAAAARVDPADVMLGQCFLDLLPMTACSTIALPADASPDHVARMGRNLDFTTFGIADKRSVLMIFHPRDRFAFASVSWPGIIGVLSGMNEHGLALANMEVTRPPRLPTAMPYSMLYRTVLEECRDVNEAIALLRRTPIQTANNLMLMDAAGNRAVVEITPEKIVVRQGRSGAALISTNHQRGEDQDRPGMCERYDCLHDTAARQFGRIDATAIEEMLRKVSQGDKTMQSMVFEPANRVIWLSTGARAADGKFEKIELSPLFTK